MAETIQLEKEALEAMLDRAAERGAQRVLHSLGLQDVNAPKDVAELRSLLESWRDVRKTAINTTVRMLTTILLGLIALGLWAKSGVGP